MTLKHPNIVEILAVSQDPPRGQYFIVMEFVEGGNLREILKSRGQVSVAEALQDHRGGGRRAGLRLHPGHHPPRHEADQHPDLQPAATPSWWTSAWPTVRGGQRRTRTRTRTRSIARSITPGWRRPPASSRATSAATSTSSAASSTNAYRAGRRWKCRRTSKIGCKSTATSAFSR